MFQNILEIKKQILQLMIPDCFLLKLWYFNKNRKRNKESLLSSVGQSIRFIRGMSLVQI